MLVGTSSTIIGHRRTASSGVEVDEYFGALGTSPSDSPVCKLVKQPDDYVSRPHFHRVDQYQLIVGGSGRLGAHDVRRGTVHYSDSSTPYGPISPNVGGLSYLTLRPPAAPMTDTSARWMPESRTEMTLYPGRNLTKSFEFDWSGPDETRVLLNEADGVGVTAQRTKARESIAAPPSYDAKYPSYLIILDGDVSADDQTHSALACIWLEASEPWPELVAGQEGAASFHLSFGEGVERRPRA